MGVGKCRRGPISDIRATPFALCRDKKSRTRTPRVLRHLADLARSAPITFGGDGAGQFMRRGRHLALSGNRAAPPIHLIRGSAPLIRGVSKQTRYESLKS